MTSTRDARLVACWARRIRRFLPAACLLLAAMGLALAGATAAATHPSQLPRAAQTTVPSANASGTASTTRPTTSTTEALAPVPTRWLLVGDSVASSVADALQAEAARRGISLANRTRSGCGLVAVPPLAADGSEVPWGRGCADGARSHLAGAVDATRPELVLWLSTWEAADHLYDGRKLPIRSEAGDAALVHQIESSIALLSSRGARVVILTNPARTPDNDISLAAPPELVGRTEHLNVIYRRLALRNPESVLVVDLAELVCPGGPPCPATVGGMRPRPRDGSHFEGDGPAWLAPRLLDAVVSVWQRSVPAPERNGP